MSGTFSMHGGMCPQPYNILVGELEQKVLLGRSGHRWKDSTNMAVKANGCQEVHRVQLARSEKWRHLVNPRGTLWLPGSRVLTR